MIEVKITGEIRNPGTFLVSSATTLTELYTLAGGFLPNAFQNGIALELETQKFYFKVTDLRATHTHLELISDAGNIALKDGHTVRIVEGL